MSCELSVISVLFKASFEIMAALHPTIWMKKHEGTFFSTPDIRVMHNSQQREKKRIRVE